MQIDIQVSTNWIKNSYKTFGRTNDKKYCGVTQTSNWLIPGKLLVGGYPDKEDDIENIENAGINTFVCLNEEYGRTNLHRPFPKYGDNLSPTSTFVHFPMRDMSQHARDKELLDFCVRLVNLLLNGNTLFIHCSGGHGRTGMVACIILHLLTGQDADVLFDYIQYCHDQRTYHNFGHKFFGQHLPDDVKKNFVMGQVPTPQLDVQRYQVYRCIIEYMKQQC